MQNYISIIYNGYYKYIMGYIQHRFDNASKDKYSLVFAGNTHFVPDNRNVFVGNVASPFILLAHTH